MVARLSVGSRYTEALLILSGLGAAGIATFAWFRVPRGKPDPDLVAVAAALGVLFLLRLCLVRLGRRWISPTEMGFILEDRRGTFAFTYDDISDLATESTVQYSGGEPRATFRSGTITLHEGAAVRRVPFRYKFRLDQPDPLTFFLDRTLTHLTDRAFAALAAGDGLRGEQWELTAEGLWLPAGRVERHIPAEDITAIDLVDGQVCVWATGEPLPSVRVPAGSANALVLLNLVGALVKARGGDPDEAVGGLGRVLFERAKSGKDSASPRALLGVTLAFASAFAVLGAMLDGAVGAALGVAGFAVVATPLFLLTILLSGTVFRCHARGVFRRSWWRSRELRFEDVGRFAYGATRSYYNGFYVGTSVWMRFTPRPGSGGRTVTYSVSLKNGDAELENLREHVSRVIAGHMFHRLERGETVAWTEGLRFRREGLEWTSGGWFTRPTTRLIPYHQIGNTDIQEGHFYLYVLGIRKAVYTTPVSADNFFPGLTLLDLIRYRPVVGQVNPYSPQARSGR